MSFGGGSGFNPSSGSTRINITNLDLGKLHLKSSGLFFDVGTVLNGFTGELPAVTALSNSLNASLTDISQTLRNSILDSQASLLGVVNSTAGSLSATEAADVASLSNSISVLSSSLAQTIGSVLSQQQTYAQSLQGQVDSLYRLESADAQNIAMVGSTSSLISQRLTIAQSQIQTLQATSGTLTYQAAANASSLTTISSSLAGLQQTTAGSFTAIGVGLTSLSDRINAANVIQGSISGSVSGIVSTQSQLLSAGQSVTASLSSLTTLTSSITAALNAINADEVAQTLQIGSNLSILSGSVTSNANGINVLNGSVSALQTSLNYVVNQTGQAATYTSSSLTSLAGSCSVLRNANDLSNLQIQSLGSLTGLQGSSISSLSSSVTSYGLSITNLVASDTRISAGVSGTFSSISGSVSSLSNALTSLQTTVTGNSSSLSTLLPMFNAHTASLTVIPLLSASVSSQASAFSGSLSSLTNNLAASAQSLNSSITSLAGFSANSLTALAGSISTLAGNVTSLSSAVASSITTVYGSISALSMAVASSLTQINTALSAHSAGISQNASNVVLLQKVAPQLVLVNGLSVTAVLGAIANLTGTLTFPSAGAVGAVLGNVNRPSGAIKNVYSVAYSSMTGTSCAYNVMASGGNSEAGLQLCTAVYQQ